MSNKPLVYVLQHTVLIDENQPKLLGVFASRESAEKAVCGFLRLRGFEKHPDGFSIDKYEVDKVYWETGFIVD